MRGHATSPRMHVQRPKAAPLQCHTTTQPCRDPAGRTRPCMPRSRRAQAIGALCRLLCVHPEPSPRLCRSTISIAPSAWQSRASLHASKTCFVQGHALPVPNLPRPSAAALIGSLCHRLAASASLSARARAHRVPPQRPSLWLELAAVLCLCTSVVQCFHHRLDRCNAANRERPDLAREHALAATLCPRTQTYHRGPRTLGVRVRAHAHTLPARP